MLRSTLKMMKQAAKGFTLNAQPAAVEMFTFNSPKVVQQWHVFTDAYFGGRSHAAFEYNEAEQAAEFSGRVTLEQEEDADIKRAGYAVASSKVTHIADYYDLSGCTHLVMEVKGDGRTYIANVRTDSIAGTGGDVWQAPFRTSAADCWQQVSIPLSSLVLTYQGQLVQRRLEFQASQVIAVGVAASAMPGAEADAAVVAAADISLPPAEQLMATEQQTSSSSSNSGAASASEGASSVAASHSSEGSSSSNSSTSSLEAAGWSSSSSSDVSSSSGSSASSFPEHEQFRLLIRSIQAEVEF